MRKVFEVELASAYSYTQLALPAGPYAMLDALKKLRLEFGETPKWELLKSCDAWHIYQYLDQEDGSLAELNALAQRLALLKDQEFAVIEGLAAMEPGPLGQSIPLSRLIDMAYSTDCCHLVEGVVTDAQLGRFCAENGFIPEAENLSDAAFELLDFEKLGRQFRETEGGVFTCGGYVQRREELRQVYRTLNLAQEKPDYTILARTASGCEVKFPLPANEPMGTELVRCVDCAAPTLIGITGGMEHVDLLARYLSEMEKAGTLAKFKAITEADGCNEVCRALSLADDVKLNDFDYLIQLPGAEREQSWIRMWLETLSMRESIILTATAQDDPPENAMHVIHRLQFLDEYRVYPDVDSYEALGRHYLLNETKIPINALSFLDLEEVGLRYHEAYPGMFIGRCYVRYPSYLPEQFYTLGGDLPDDNNWSIKVKLASPTVPEGVWLRLPCRERYGSESSIEEALALRELCVQRWGDCTLLDARCILPEAGDLLEQYDNVADLLYDGQELGYVLDEHDQDTQTFMERYTAALELEHCQDLRFAPDISQNLRCYDWVQRADLESSADDLLWDAGVSYGMIYTSSFDPEVYKAHLLEQEGYTPTSDGSGYIRRNNQEFSYQFSTPVQPQEEPGMTMQ